MKVIKTKTKLIKLVVGTVFLILVLANFSYAQAAYTAGTLVSMTNSARAREGLGSLTVNSQLSSAAAAKAEDMLANQYFAHTSPSGKTPWDFIRDAGYSYSYAGENLAIGYTDASELFTAWMNSSTHRANILNSNFREIGIAVISGTYEGQETMIVAQEFGAPMGSSEQVASENSTPTPETNSSQEATNTTPAPQKTFGFIKDKSSFNPHSIFAGEEVTFFVTVSGEIQTLEVKALDQKLNLLESAAVTGSGKEKTYSMAEKIAKEGNSDVTVFAKDKYGNEKHLILGKLEVKQVAIVKNTTGEPTSWLAGFKQTVKNHWLVIIIAGGVLLAGAGYLILRKIKFGKLSKLGLSSWEL